MYVPVSIIIPIFIMILHSTRKMIYILNGMSFYRFSPIIDISMDQITLERLADNVVKTRGQKRRFWNVQEQATKIVH